MNQLRQLIITRCGRLHRRLLIVVSVIFVYIMIQAWYDTEQRLFVESGSSKDIQESIRKRNNVLTTAKWWHSEYNQTSITPKISTRIDNATRQAYLFMPYLGRFGNNLFQYASAYGIARDTSHTVVIRGGAKDALKAMFKGITAPVRWIDPERPIETLIEKGAGIYSSALIQQSTNDISICCFLQSWKYFDKYAKEIRKEFTFNDNLVQSAMETKRWLVDQHVRKMAKSNVTFHTTTVKNLTIIGIHVRRRDFRLKHMNIRGYTSAPSSYFHKAIEYFRSQYNDTLFIVCSDEPSWAMNNLAYTDNKHKVHDIQFVTSPTNVDFPLLASCDHVIISVGSYSWWAGWLSGGTVVYHNGWPKPGNEIGDLYNQQDYYHPTWVSIGA